MPRGCGFGLRGRQRGQRRPSESLRPAVGLFDVSHRIRGLGRSPARYALSFIHL